MPHAFVFFLVLIVVLVVLSAIFGRRARIRRQEALAAWAAREGLSCSTEPDREFEERYPGFDCLRRGSNRYAEVLMAGQHAGRDVSAFIYHYETQSTDSKGRTTTHTHRFSGVVIDSGLPLKPLSLRPEGFLDRFTEFLGWDDIDFESGAFSRAFYVRAPDRRWAFDVFTQATMEFLLAQPRFTLQMSGPWLLVRRSGRMAPSDFSHALAVAEGILDRLPRYLIRELKGEEA